MSVRPDPVIPETRRRRASTTEKSERILKMSRSLTLTRSVLAGTLAEATPNHVCVQLVVAGLVTMIFRV